FLARAGENLDATPPSTRTPFFEIATGVEHVGAGNRSSRPVGLSLSHCNLHSHPRRARPHSLRAREVKGTQVANAERNLSTWVPFPSRSQSDRSAGDDKLLFIFSISV